MATSLKMAKRETIGSRLKRAREQAGMSVPQLVRQIREDHGKDVGASTVRDAENDKTPNPGIKTVETIALGLGLDAIEVIGLALDDAPETDPGYKESGFARLWKSYQRLKKDRRPFWDELIEMLTDKMNRQN